MDIESIQNVFTTVQDQIQTLQEESLYVPTEQLDWRVHGDRLLSSNMEWTSNHNKNDLSSAILCCVSAENVNRIHDREKCGSRWKLLISFLPKSIANSLTSPRSQSCSSGGSTQNTLQLRSSKKSRRWWSTRLRCIRSMSRSASSLCRCTATLTGPKGTMNTYEGKIYTAYQLMSRVFRPDAGHVAPSRWGNVLRDPRIQSRKKVEEHCQNSDERICRQWTPSAQVFEPIIQRINEKQRRWKILHAFQCSSRRGSLRSDRSAG